MTLLDFLDKHWGFWFSLFVLAVCYCVSWTLVAIVAVIGSLLRGDSVAVNGIYVGKASDL